MFWSVVWALTCHFSLHKAKNEGELYEVSLKSLKYMTIFSKKNVCQ